MKYPVVIIALLFTSLSVSAQIERKPASIKPDSSNRNSIQYKDKKQTQKDRLKALDLSKEQWAKVKEIRQEGKAAREAIENNTDLSQDERTKQLRKLQRENAQKIQAILTEEQKARLRASKENNP